MTGAIFAASAARCWPAPPVTRAGHQPPMPALPPASPLATAPLLPPRRRRPHYLRWHQTGDLRTGGGHATRPNAWPSALPPRGAVSAMEGSALHQRCAIEARTKVLRVAPTKGRPSGYRVAAAGRGGSCDWPWALRRGCHVRRRVEEEGEPRCGTAGRAGYARKDGWGSSGRGACQ